MEFVWKIKNKGRGLAEFKFPQLTEGIAWDGKDVEFTNEAIDDDFLNDIIGNNNKADL